MWNRRRTPISDEERVVKDPAKARERTMNRAVRLLAAKPRSTGELRQRLLEKLWTDAEIVDGVIEKLLEYQYLNDKQYAADLALSKLRQKPQGRRRLEFSLSQKPLDRELIDEAVTAAYEKLPETEMIDVAIEKRVRLKGRPETREELKKFYDHLLRQGFAFDLIRERVARLKDSQ